MDFIEVSFNDKELVSKPKKKSAQSLHKSVWSIGIPADQ
ncbi:hypothetical protein LEP1GSC133_3817 [Leptospira borgpetersenii serovar Pomona str. 200901868]|uniref:Uncharacterized protein n=1 Tax=Leptospira borgpetersenii serovar Pomona str. 200901868 TaxID=1192866 RepID=M6W3V7_LEPBO|nr:hypothetical protein LEP1GSC133_3817 [Leptospira borgpetersenii serovar Pomona str. 200901868]